MALRNYNDGLASEADGDYKSADYYSWTSTLGHPFGAIKSEKMWE